MPGLSTKKEAKWLRGRFTLLFVLINSTSLHHLHTCIVGMGEDSLQTLRLVCCHVLLHIHSMHS